VSVRGINPGSLISRGSGLNASIDFAIENGGNTVVIKDHRTEFYGEIELFENTVSSFATAANYNSWNDNMLVPAGVVKTIIDGLTARIDTLEGQLAS
jgi:hypothetical protein